MCPLLFYMAYTWSHFIEEEAQKPYYQELQSFIQEQRKNESIYPPESEVFSAFELTPFNKVKVVILGQDPYHGEGEAHGLAFSVRKGVKVPPSLVNIFKELKSDLDIDPPGHGNLEAWAREGVLLLNTVLTVKKNKAGSHHKKGWEIFTDTVVDVLSSQKKDLVFILWGAPSQKKAARVDRTKHHVITSPHPSPLSSYRGFFGSKPFSKTNEFLVSHSLKPINWQL